MLKLLVTPILALMLALIATPAQAFFDPPWITPEHPSAGELVSVNIHGGECDTIAEREGYPQITVEGTHIRLVEYGRHYEPGDVWCIYGEWTFVRPIGTFPSGNYTLTVDLVYPDPVFNTPTIYPIGVVSFTVRGSEQAVAVPAMGTLAALVLFAAVALGAARKLRRKPELSRARVLVGVSLDARAQAAVGVQLLLSNTLGAPATARESRRGSCGSGGCITFAIWATCIVRAT